MRVDIKKVLFRIFAKKNKTRSKRSELLQVVFRRNNTESSGEKTLTRRIVSSTIFI
jgi:hypothetical protein